MSSVESFIGLVVGAQIRTYARVHQARHQGVGSLGETLLRGLPRLYHIVAKVGDQSQGISVLELGDQAYGGAIRETFEKRTGRVASSGARTGAEDRVANRNPTYIMMSEVSSSRYR